ncbi:MAG TPA: carboxypeptidase-like regulatory domain-containing protein [Bryobacteraceae bacterium]|nr:carboxypeptidase-like regulatory domain-containing protein [Bryobacteraceae bacterium]
MKRSICSIVSALVVGLFLLPLLALAQITVGTMSGRIVDASGAVVVGAKVDLISETQNTRTTAVLTNAEGDYVIPNLAPDTYTIEVSAPSFKTLRRRGIVVTGGDRVGVPPLALEVGGTTETVSVTAEMALLQTQSSERSTALEQTQINELPISHGNFGNVVPLIPGVMSGGNSAIATRLGGAAQNNVMMDGISAMDTGNNGQMLTMNIESIGEVKVLTQGYQAEYGRSSGLQITSYSKSGTNEFHGSGYGLFTRWNWNKNSWANQNNGVPQAKTVSSIYGYSIGGPVWIPKVFNGKNKLFFFYAHEFRPTTTAINSGNVIQVRMPTALERAGNFSQSLNNQGVLIGPIMDYQSGAPFPGNIIPADRLYAPGVAVLSQYPLPNFTQGPGQNYNWQINAPTYSYLLQQPAGKIDYQATQKLRLSAKYSGQIQNVVVTPGYIPGFNDAEVPYPYIYNLGASVTYVISPRTFIEGTYGTIKNQLAGGNEGGIPVDASSNRLTALPTFPELYPNAGQMNPGYYGYQVLQSFKAPFYSNGTLNMNPIFGWGSLITTNVCSTPAPACQRYPGWLNVNHTQDVAANVTHVQGTHTFKAGAYLNHSYKAQNTGAGGIANLTFQGYVDFGNNSNNTLDSGFGYANAALGVFNQYQQASKFIEGDYLYNQIEGYVQDTWKVTKHLTLDYGVRFVHQQPQYDKFDQSSNFNVAGLWQGGGPAWSSSNAPVLYVAGCSNGAAACSGNLRNAMNPLNGQIITVAGAANTQALIGTPIPGVGNTLDGITQAGHGIAGTNYVWPAVVLAPRFGVAWDVTGRANWVIRGGVGLFYDRPDGNTIFSTPGNPPTATEQNLLEGQLQTLGTGTGLSPQPVSSLVTFLYNAQIPTEVQWNVGLQKSLPGSMVADVSYVGNHGYNLLGVFQGGDLQNLNSVDYGTAYLAKYQDPTLGTSSVPGATAYTTNLLRPYAGLGVVNQNTTGFFDTYHSLQFSLNRRFSRGLLFGINYTRELHFISNQGLVVQTQHSSTGAISLLPDWGAYQKLNEKYTNDIPNYFVANAVWSIPSATRAGAFVHQLTKDWQLGSITTLHSGTPFTPGYSYQANGGNVNITGSPDYGGRMVVLNPAALGNGCSGNRYSEFNATALQGPTYGSLGMESGRDILRNCATIEEDMNIVRRISINERFKLALRLDIYNLPNNVQITSINSTATFNNPAAMTLVNNQYNGTTLNSARLTPATAGFGAATAAAAMRNILLEVRVQF